MTTTPPPRPLIVRLTNWVGDVVLGVPSLKLMQAHGYAPVLVGRGWAGALLEGEGWPVHKHPKSLAERVALLKALAAEARAVDAGFGRRVNAFTFPNSLSSALELRLAGLKGHGYRNEGRAPLLAKSVPLPRTRGHELVRHWELACSFLGIAQQPPPARITLALSDAQRHRAAAALARHGVRDGYVVIAPFAAGNFDKQDKKWPRFPAFTQALLASGRDVVVCPGPGEEERLAREQHAGTIVVSGIDLGAYLGVLQRAALVVANDTGPGHMAAAVGAPLLSVLGPTDPGVFGAWGPTVQYVRDPAWPAVDTVLAKAEALLASHAMSS